MLDQPSRMYPKVHLYTYIYVNSVWERLLCCSKTGIACMHCEALKWLNQNHHSLYVLCDDCVQLMSMCQGGVSVCAVRVVLSQSCLARTNVCLACETIQTLPYPSLLPHLCKSESVWRVWPPETPPYSAHCNNQGAAAGQSCNHCMQLAMRGCW